MKYKSELTPNMNESTALQALAAEPPMLMSAASALAASSISRSLV